MDPTRPADADPEHEDVSTILAAFHRSTAAMRTPVTAMQLLCATRVARGPVLAFVSDAEPNLALPLGVAAPAGKFAFLRLSAVEPEYHLRVPPVPVDPGAGQLMVPHPPEDQPQPLTPPRCCLSGSLAHGECRPPTMDYFAIPPATAAFFASCPRRPRIELVPAAALKVPPFLDAVYPWQVGAQTHGLAVDFVFVAQPGLVDPPADDADTTERPPEPACCWYGAAYRHAAAIVGADNIRLLRAGEKGIMEDMERGVAPVLPGAGPA